MISSPKQFTIVIAVIILYSALTVCAYNRSGQNSGSDTAKPYSNVLPTFLRHVSGKVNVKDKRFADYLFPNMTGKKKLPTCQWYTRTSFLYWNPKKTCKQKFLLLPFGAKELSTFDFMVLPNNDICLNGMKLKRNGQDVCMPQNPEVLEVSTHNKTWILFISSHILQQQLKGAELVLER